MELNRMLVQEVQVELEDWQVKQEGSQGWQEEREVRKLLGEQDRQEVGESPKQL